MMKKETERINAFCQNEKFCEHKEDSVFCTFDGECDWKAEDVEFRLTPMGCLYAVLLDYVGEDHLLDIRKIRGNVGRHIVEDFLDAMIRTGHLAKTEETDA